MKGDVRYQVVPWPSHHPPRGLESGSEGTGSTGQKQGWPTRKTLAYTPEQAQTMQGTQTEVPVPPAPKGITEPHLRLL